MGLGKTANGFPSGRSSATPRNAAAEAGDAGNVHVVSEGETLNAIAVRYLGHHRAKWTE